MATSTSARIRHFQPSDEKLVLFAVGKGNMEALAVANNKAYFNPLVLSTWVGLSCLMIEFMNWWPSQLPGWMGYIRLLPAFASMAVPIMFLIDWINRPYFEKITQDAVRQLDSKNITKHYSKYPGSGFWVLEYGDMFIGLIALEASDEEGFIHHFYVDEPYRVVNIQNDLLKHAVTHAFTKNTKLQRIGALDSPLLPYIGPCLRDAGFSLDHHTEKVGVFNWKLGKCYLERRSWKMDE